MTYINMDFDGLRYVLEYLTQRLITPTELITHRYPLADPKRGLVVMHDGGSAASKLRDRV